MKTYRYLGLLAACLLMASCKEELMEYNGPDSVYFKMYNRGIATYFDTETINLMDYVGSVVNYDLVVSITGKAAPYDRPYLVSVVDSLTTAIPSVEFDIPQGGIMKAGAYSDTLHITLHRSDRLEEEMVQLAVTLAPNEYFDVNVKKYSSTYFDPRLFTLKYTGVLEEPFWFPYHSKSTKVESENLGFFTAKKFTMINDMFGYTYSDWKDGGRIAEASLQLDVVKRITFIFSAYLIEQYRNHTPVLEADGRLMWVTGCPWTSVVGQAWDGVYIDYWADKE